MAVTAVPLNDRQLKALKPETKDYVLSDGNGLQLRVRANGSLLWNFNYSHPETKKRVNMGLGTYPTVSLANARKKAVDAKSLVAQGIDPKGQKIKTLAQAKIASEHTFFNIASEWFELKKDSVTPDYAIDIWSSFERHIFPHFGKVPISKITAPSVISALRPIEAKGNLETVKRLIQRLNEVMVYAVNGGLTFANPLSGIRANFKKPKKEHMAALKPNELPVLICA